MSEINTTKPTYLAEPTYLAKKNEHSRDKDMVFIENTHKYIISTDPDSKYTSVTTWNHSHFNHFNPTLIIKNMMKGKNWNPENKYWGMTAEEIKKKWQQDGQLAAKLGTALHYQIECYWNTWGTNDADGDGAIGDGAIDAGAIDAGAIDAGANTVEWNYFLEFAKTCCSHLKPYRTEWRIYDEDIKLAGSIDMVFENEDGTLSIYDWKRCKEISKSCPFKKHAKTKCINYLPDTNFWHYSLQLHTYKAILESKYGKVVKDLYLVQLHDSNTSFEVIKVADMTQELIKLFELRKTTELATATTSSSFASSC
jgi:hypothetical protein